MEITVNALAKYMATQIKYGKLDYNKVVTKFPQYQEDIDKVLESEGLLSKYKN